MFYFDPTMIILLPAVIFTAYAQFMVSSTTSKYFNVGTKRGFSGEQVARMILDKNGLQNVEVEMVRGRLTDHFDPRSNVVRLSQDVYYGNSITSVAVAAHECGHALQYAHGYAFLNFRSALVPVVNFSSNLSWFLIALGFMMRGPFLEIGILLFTASVLFQIITLPVEFNASHRAIGQMSDMGIVGGSEVNQSRKVLTAAALTYVAAALTSILQLVRLLSIANDRED